MTAATIHLCIGAETVVTGQTDTIVIDTPTTALHMHGNGANIDRLVRHLNRAAGGDSVEVDKAVLRRVYDHLGDAPIREGSIEFEDYLALGDALGVNQ